MGSKTLVPFRAERFLLCGEFRDPLAPRLDQGPSILLVAPALLDADRKDLKTLMVEFSDLVTRVRTGHMRSSEFMTATITVTSLGEDGVETLYPIINPPQVAIVGTGCAGS